MEERRLHFNHQISRFVDVDGVHWISRGVQRVNKKVYRVYTPEGSPGWPLNTTSVGEEH